MNAVTAAASPPPGGTAPVHASHGRSILLARRNVYILPTRHGLSFAAALCAMLVGAINYNNSLGHMLVFLLASLALVSMLHTYRNLAGLVFRPGRTMPVFAGDEARFALRLGNRGQRPRHQLVLTYARHPQQGKRGRACVTVNLTQDESTVVELPVPAPHRGALALGRVTVAGRYPLGLFRAWSYVQLDQIGMVYPRPSGVGQLPLTSTQTERESGKRGSGREDFSGFREYVPGDSPRHVHWKAVARDQGMPVKIFAGASAADIQLRWDDAGGPDIEARLSQLCLWVLEAERQGYRYGLSLPDAELAPSSGDAHRTRALTALALFGSDTGGA
ncbi:MAG: DUF58 domain-containing protein [Gammaproteobacteria bacterium]|nr:MAG: DUF58 domain-containing protein [Gammaproteobacteria bacterium]